MTIPSHRWQYQPWIGPVLVPVPPPPAPYFDWFHQQADSIGSIPQISVGAFSFVELVAVSPPPVDEQEPIVMTHTDVIIGSDRVVGY